MRDGLPAALKHKKAAFWHFECFKEAIFFEKSGAKSQKWTILSRRKIQFDKKYLQITPFPALTSHHSLPDHRGL
jgi:hypothetical protein